jgi:hypothetical protein
MTQTQMNRQVLIDQFVRTPALALANHWYGLAETILDGIALEVGKQSTSTALERAIVAQVIRIHRYLIALHRLSFPIDAAHSHWSHAVDGAHAIHKSLFETYIEFGLCLTYAELFDAEADENGHELWQRMYLYSDFAKRKRNRERLFRIDQLQATLSHFPGGASLPQHVETFIAKGTDGVKEDLIAQAKLIGGEDARFARLSHWFPEKLGERYFVKTGEKSSNRPSNCGSIEWTCKAVLAEHFPDRRLRAWWAQSYDQDYDLLNLFAHPVLGYEDAFRSEAERRLDLARMQIPMRFAFHLMVLPTLKAMFPNACLPRLTQEAELDNLFQDLNRLVLPYLLQVDQLDHQASQISTP